MAFKNLFFPMTFLTFPLIPLLSKVQKEGEKMEPILPYSMICKFHVHMKDRSREKFIIFVSAFQNYSHLYDSVIVSSIKLLE